MTSPTLERIADHREHISDLLVRGRVDEIDSEQERFIDGLEAGPSAMRVRREIDDLPRRLLFAGARTRTDPGRSPSMKTILTKRSSPSPPA